MSDSAWPWLHEPGAATVEAAAAKVAERAAAAQVPGRMPAVVSGARRAAAARRPCLGGRARGVGGGAAPSGRRPDGLRALAAGAAADARSDRGRRAARLRLLRVPRAVLPGHVHGPTGAGARGARRGAPGRRARRWPTTRAADSTTAPTSRSSRCTRRRTCPCCSSRCRRWIRQALARLGGALRPLRDEGVLIIGSGFMTHGLPYLRDFVIDAPPPDWSKDFDQWAAAALERHDLEELAAFAACRRRATPTRRPSTSCRCFVAAGAAEPDGEWATPITGFWLGLSKRSVQFA